MAFHSTLELSEEALILKKVEQICRSQCLIIIKRTRAFKDLSHTQGRIQKNSLRKAQG